MERHRLVVAVRGDGAGAVVFGNCDPAVAQIRIWLFRRPRGAADQQRRGGLRLRHPDERHTGPLGPHGAAPPVHDFGAAGGRRQCRHPGARCVFVWRHRAQIPHRCLHGRNLSGRHEDGGDLGQAGYRPLGRPVGRRPDHRLGLSPSFQRRRRGRVALYPGRNIGAGARRRAAGQFCQPRPGTRYALALRAVGDAEGVEQQGSALRQSRLFRPCVGNLRDVGVDRPLSPRKLPGARRDGRRRGQILCQFSMPIWRASR